MSNIDFTLNLLDIKDENIKVLDVYEETIGNNRTKIIKARLSYDPGRCPDCGKCELVKNGFSKEISVKLVSLNGIPYKMQLKKQRFKCKNCHSTSLAHSPALVFNSSFSKAVKLRIIELSKDCLTLKEIAKLLGISISSVYRILYRSCHYRKSKHYLPTNLSFDEFLLKKDHYAFIGIDADTHRLLALLPGRTNHTVSQYFINHYSLQQRQQVQTVTIDMNANYASFIPWLFPNAEIIIDRFHVIQLVQRTLREARINALNGIDDHHSRQYKALKTYWKLYNKSEDQLEAKYTKYYRGLNEFTTQQNIVDLGLQDSQEFETTYTVYQTILEAVQSRDYSLIEILLKEYKSTHTSLDTTIRTLHKNATGIKNALKYSYSNGPIEGINRKIKTLKRISYGFKNQENFFTRIQLILK